ncbi:MAG TPA: NUDIX hydrolase [Gaiellaceae bacterium]|nr:NUDIX hydrolase [Gaiellaceae bacterium]
MIKAAGCVVVRDGRVLLIHRERYDDWSLPKGKLEPGESWEDAAVREVEEETGVRGELGEYLGETSYTGKVVRWWLMATTQDAAPSNEVDAVEWATLDEARGRLTYERDRKLVERVLA